MYYSKRQDGPGYLEYIYRKDGSKDERIAYITNIYSRHIKDCFTCVYGCFEFNARTVFQAKEALFDAIAHGL